MTSTGISSGRNPPPHQIVYSHGTWISFRVLLAVRHTPEFLVTTAKPVAL